MGKQKVPVVIEPDETKEPTLNERRAIVRELPGRLVYPYTSYRSQDTPVGVVQARKVIAEWEEKQEIRREQWVREADRRLARLRTLVMTETRDVIREAIARFWDWYGSIT